MRSELVNDVAGHQGLRGGASSSFLSTGLSFTVTKSGAAVKEREKENEGNT